MSDRDLVKKEAGATAGRATPTKSADVFDTAGNDAIKQKIAQVEAETGGSAQSKQTLLDKVEKQAGQGKQPGTDAGTATNSALKQQAVAARDEVILQMQMVTSNADLLNQLQGCESVYQASTAVVEMVAQNVADDDMAALAAYSHNDLMQGKILSPESHLETRGVSAQALKMGAFVPILWQLVNEQFLRADVQVGGGETGGSGLMMGSGGASVPNDPRALAAPLLRAAGVMSTARSSSIV